MADLNTFAIGDIHGCFDEMAALLAVCEAIITGKAARFVFVGDYVDRGPDPRKVLDFLIESQLEKKERFICLRGNHEHLLINAVASDRTNADLLNWLVNGGEQTQESYGIDDPVDLPETHLAWIKALPLQFTDGPRLYVHAGIRPGVPLADQAERDLLWIREPFLSSDENHGPLIVHGHTPTDSGLPDLRANRLNLDTGACFGRELTAALFHHRPGRATVVLKQRRVDLGSISLRVAVSGSAKGLFSTNFMRLSRLYLRRPLSGIRWF